MTRERRRLRAQGAVYRGQTLVGIMRIEGWILPDRRIVGTARTIPHVPYPRGEAVPRPLVMRSSDEPKLRLHCEHGTIEFHLGSDRGVLLDAHIAAESNSPPSRH